MDNLPQPELQAVSTRRTLHRPLFFLVLLCLLHASLAWAQEGTASSASAKANTAAAKAAETTELADGDAAAEDQDANPEAAVDAAVDPAADDIEWLTDALGRYRVVKVPKGVEGRHYMWIGENRVQLNRGLRFEVVDHDESSFWVKAYESTYKAQEIKTPVRTAEDDTRAAKMEETYASEAGNVDRLSFVPFDEGLPRRGQWRNAFDVADMNADGHLDIVFGAARKSSPRPNIFLSNGEGKWANWRARYPDFPYDYGSATVADLNGDGHQDIVLGMHLRGILVLIGDSTGQFRAWTEGIGLEIPGKGGDGSTFSSTAIKAVDWDSDGDLDLLALGEGPKGVRMIMEEGGEMQTANGPVLFVNQGDGTWEPQGQASRVFGGSLALGDFNGDERIDFITSNNSRNHQLLNLGGEGVEWEAKHMPGLRRNAFPFAVASGRLNGDAIDDLMIGYMSRELGVWRSGVDIFFGQEGGTWSRRHLFSVEGRAGVYAMGSGNLDGDDYTDIGLVTGDGGVHLFLGNEEGFFDHEASLPDEFLTLSEGCRGHQVSLADLNQDGLDEVIVALAGEGTGLPGILDKPGCVDGGSLRVWSPRHLETPAEPAEGR